MASRRYTGGKHNNPGRESGGSAPRARVPESDLSRILGNRLITQMQPRQERVQMKSREEGPGDAMEQDADQAAAMIAPAAPGARGAAENPATAPVAGPSLIVDDETASSLPGQMAKAEFLSELRAAVCATADEGLAVAGKNTEGCPWIEYWLNFYSTKDASHLERALFKFAPDAAGAKSARDYIPAIAARVRKAVDTYAKTREVTDVPEMSEGASGLMALAGGISFKAKEGGAHGADNPASVRAQL